MKLSTLLQKDDNLIEAALLARLTTLEETTRLRHLALKVKYAARFPKVEVPS